MGVHGNDNSTVSVAPVMDELPGLKFGGWCSGADHISGQIFGTNGPHTMPGTLRHDTQRTCSRQRRIGWAPDERAPSERRRAELAACGQGEPCIQREPQR